MHEVICQANPGYSGYVAQIIPEGGSDCDARYNTYLHFVPAKSFAWSWCARVCMNSVHAKGGPEVCHVWVRVQLCRQFNSYVAYCFHCIHAGSATSQLSQPTKSDFMKLVNWSYKVGCVTLRLHG